MSPQELKATLSLSLVFAFRMFGLFMVLPVMVLYADDLQGATPALTGLAIGAYGFSQALLQIPFGWLSDRIGRKPVILLGLLIFLLGSLVSAQAETIQEVIFGRVLQGCGAIAGAVTALLADLTRDQHRTKAMAIFGMSIGLSFCVAMIIGPLFASWWGLSGIFTSNAVMVVIAMFIVLLLVPSPVISRRDLNTSVSQSEFGAIFRNRELLRLMAGIFILHFIVMGLFVFFPRLLQDTVGLARESHGWVYMISLVTSFAFMIPFIILSEKYRLMKQCFSGAVALLLVSMMVMLGGESSTLSLMLGIFLFFVAFNFLEASLPSLVSKLSPAGTRGSAMGLYSSCQFLGAGLGGALGGLALDSWGVSGVIVICVIPTALWCLLSVTMKQPPYVSSMVMALDPSVSLDAHSMGRELAVIPGVEEVTVLDSERTAYLKVDRRSLDLSALRQYGEC
ncbi:MAG: MFS transporter [Endozoicomonas sp.]